MIEAQNLLSAHMSLPWCAFIANCCPRSQFLQRCQFSAVEVCLPSSAFLTLFVLFFYFFLFCDPRVLGSIRFLSKSSLLVQNVGRRDRGVYQCLVENQRASAQAMAELKLGGELTATCIVYETEFWHLSSYPMLLIVYFAPPPTQTLCRN